MKLILYNTESDRRVVGKSLNLIKVIDNVTIKDSMDLVNPVIELDYFKSALMANYAMLDCDGWAKYYFIDKRNIKSGQVLEFTLFEDVRESLKNLILSSRQLINRQENKSLSNKAIVDELMPLKTERNVFTRNFSGTPFSINSMNSNTSKCIALTVNGGISVGGV